MYDKSKDNSLCGRMDPAIILTSCYAFLRNCSKAESITEHESRCPRSLFMDGKFAQTIYQQKRELITGCMNFWYEQSHMCCFEIMAHTQLEYAVTE